MFPSSTQPGSLSGSMVPSTVSLMHKKFPKKTKKHGGLHGVQPVPPSSSSKPSFGGGNQFPRSDSQGDY